VLTLVYGMLTGELLQSTGFAKESFLSTKASSTTSVWSEFI